MAAVTPYVRPVLYPRQLVIMIDHETADRIEADAARRSMPKGAVARQYIRAGIESLGK